MMLSEELPDRIGYIVSVPLDKTFTTHDWAYLEKINAPGGRDVLINALGRDNKHWLTEDVLLSRNKAPHGLGGLLLWHFGWKNFLELNTAQQIIFCGYLIKIELELRKTYWDMYQILLWMCLSKNAGVGKRQSIAFTHAHFSLIPKGKPPLLDHGVKFEILPEWKKITGHVPVISRKLKWKMNQFGAIKSYHGDSTVLMISRESAPEVQIPHDILHHLGNEDKETVLAAKNEWGVEVGSTISLLLTQSMRTRIAVSLGTPGYLHFDGIELLREFVNDERWAKFDQFWKICFESVRDRL